MTHHSEWTNVFHVVTVRLWTHDAGQRVTMRNEELAHKLEKLFRSG